MIYIGWKQKAGKWFLFGVFYTLLPVILIFIFGDQILNGTVTRNEIIFVWISIYLIAYIHGRLSTEYLNLVLRVEEEEASIYDYPTETQNVEESSHKVLLDINSCTEDELAELPGIGLILAKKTINMRNEKGCFSTVNEFIDKLSISPHYAERLRDMLCCTVMPNSNLETVKTSVRMVDY